MPEMVKLVPDAVSMNSKSVSVIVLLVAGEPPNPVLETLNMSVPVPPITVPVIPKKVLT